MADVSTPTKAHTAMVTAARVVRTLVAGTDAMRKARELYLPREEAETETSYDNRLARTFLFNATGKTVIDMTDKVFVKPVTFQKDVNPQLKEWAENIDNAGRHINVFACDAFKDSLQPGIGYIFVDAPPPPARADGAPPTIADYQATKWRPYCTFVPVENLIGWKTTTVNGAVVLTQIRIKECLSEPDGEYGEKDVDQIRVVSTNGLGTGCLWQTFRKPDNSDAWILRDEGAISLPAIPLAPIYINRTQFMQGEPPLAKLAELNVAHWQSSSDQRNIVHTARVPILFYAGAGDSAKLTIGAGSAIFNSDPNAKLTYVEHSGAAIDAGDKDLQNLEMQMQAMGLQLMIDGPKGQTATGEIHDDAKENSGLAMMATALQDALEQAFGFMAQFAGLPEQAGGSIVVNKDFGIGGNRFDIQFLTQAYIAGKLDTETYINEMKRRGALSEDVDVEEVLGRLEAQAPDLSAGVPPGKGMNLGAAA